MARRGQSGETAAALIPPRATLVSLRRAAAGCKACDLWQRGTQTVFGEGAAHAEVMFVGEQPGNDEDLAGRPFVGPAGRLLDRALEAAGIDRTPCTHPRSCAHPTRRRAMRRWSASSRT